jgi:hypothetical protein
MRKQLYWLSNVARMERGGMRGIPSTAKRSRITLRSIRATCYLLPADFSKSVYVLDLFVEEFSF